MAWSAPSTQTTGTLITAAIWNQDVVDNVQFLYDNVLSWSQNHYDSGWFAVGGVSQTYNKAHGLGSAPRFFVLLFATSATPTSWYVAMTSLQASSYARQIGHQCGATNITVTTNAGGTGNTLDDPIAGTVSSGYYRILAWL